MTQAAEAPTIQWAADDCLSQVADFISGVVGLDTGYISHGEIQTGLSVDGRTWVSDLGDRMREDFVALGPDRRVAVALVDGDIVGAGVAFFQQHDRARYVVIEDIAVSPEARSGGIGGRLIDFMEAAAREGGYQWAFLESGLNNVRAHALFERLHYRPLSKIFCKPL